MLNCAAAIPQPGAAPAIRLVSRNDTLRGAHRAACALCELCLSGEPGPKDTGKIADVVYTRKRVKRGEALLRAGSRFESLYAIRSGFFKSSVMLEDGRDQIVGFPMAGNVVGMDGIATGEHTADLVALEDGEVCVLPYERLHDSTLQRRLHKVMSRELVREHGIVTLLGTLKSDERVAAFLLNLAERFAVRGFSPNEYHLRMTREEIGSYLGLSLETVSRMLSRFHDDGLIAVQQRHVRILDAAGLRAIVFHP